MTSMTRPRVRSLTFGLSFSTRETVPTLTPAVAATSAILTRWAEFRRLTSLRLHCQSGCFCMEPLPLEVLLGSAGSQATGLAHLGHVMTSASSCNPGQPAQHSQLCRAAGAA